MRASCKSVLTFAILALILSFVPIGTVTADDGNNSQLLEAAGIFPYPTEAELKGSRFSKDWMKVEPIGFDDIRDDFSNLEDLAWLKPIAKKNRVILFGESHWSTTIRNLLNRVLFALNTFDRYPFIVTEYPYSLSAFYDYYVGLDDEEAKAFYENVIYDFVYTKEEFSFIEHIRRWNRVHRDHRIHIGCRDIEHDYVTTLRWILIPYFRKLDPTFNIDLEHLLPIDLEPVVKDLRQRLVLAQSKRLKGDFPFLTPQYIETIIANLESLYLNSVYSDSGGKYRQLAIIRNLTDPKFLGEYFKKGKVLIYGGNSHAPTRFRYPNGDNFLKEGSYFSFEYPPTRGKTYSIAVYGLSWKMGPMATLDLSQSLRHATKYLSYVKTFQRLYKQKAVSQDAFYLFNTTGLNEFEKLVLATAHANQNRPMWVQEMNWEALKVAALPLDKELLKDIRTEQYFFEMFDAFIFVPQSPIEVLNAKRRPK